MNTTPHNTPPQPQPETTTDSLPTALTFFVTRAQRRHILSTLRTISDDRSRALSIALSQLAARKELKQ